MDDAGLPIVGVRMAEGRCGSTLLMELLATADEIVFDDRYPAEYRFASYFARMAGAMTEPFDQTRHAGVTPFFFGPEPVWGPIPFATEVIDRDALRPALLAQMWVAWSGAARARNPGARLYAEKLAVDVAALTEAGIPVWVVDLVRDPRDVLASIRSFTARGVDGFGRDGTVDEAAYVERFVATIERGFTRLLDVEPDVDRVLVRYEELVTELPAVAARLGAWLGVELDAARAAASWSAHGRHSTSPSPAASIGRWRRDLGAAEAAGIAERLGPLAARVGYEL